MADTKKYRRWWKTGRENVQPVDDIRSYKEQRKTLGIGLETAEEKPLHG